MQIFNIQFLVWDSLASCQQLHVDADTHMQNIYIEKLLHKNYWLINVQKNKENKATEIKMRGEKGGRTKIKINETKTRNIINLK